MTQNAQRDVRVFLSYTENVREDRLKTVKRINQDVRNIIESFGWSVLDPMTNPDNKTISSKVKRYLKQADCVIIDYSDNANVNFESGFTEALGCPCIFLKSSDTPKINSDNGDVEYREYPVDIDKNPDAYMKFIGDLRKVLLELKELSDGSIFLNRRKKKFISGVDSLIKDERIDDIFLRTVAALLGKMEESVAGAARHEVTVPSFFYSSVLESLASAGHGIKAIADLTDDIEDWSKGGPSLWQGVSERIFHIDWMDFFNVNANKSVQETIKYAMQNDGGGCRIFLTTTRETDNFVAVGHPLGAYAAGRHLFLIGSGFVGGYKNIEKSRMLCVSGLSKNRFLEAERYYNFIKNYAVEITEDIDLNKENALRAKWVEKHGIGVWNSRWSRYSETRDNRYFGDYDRHIRLWIPLYDKLIEDCSNAVQKTILEVYKNKQRSLNVMEIGYGTGFLSMKIIEWARKLNDPFFETGKIAVSHEENGPVKSYAGVDRAETMKDIAVRRIGSGQDSLDKYLKISMSSGGFDAEHPKSFVEKSDVIFGNLVLHFLIDEDSDANRISVFFDNLKKNYLSEGGKIVFSGVFFKDESSRNRQIDLWKEAMINEGMKESEAEAFLTHNKDMTSAPTYGVMQEAARKSGLTVEPYGSFDRLPFNVLSFRCKAVSSAA